MKKKERLSRRLEVRLSNKEFNKLKTRARLYAKGDVSSLIRYWIENADIPKRREEDEQLR